MIDLMPGLPLEGGHQSFLERLSAAAFGVFVNISRKDAPNFGSMCTRSRQNAVLWRAIRIKPDFDPACRRRPCITSLTPSLL